MQPTEAWLPVSGWEGMYSVSNFGRVRSEARAVVYVNGKTQTVRERILRAATKKSGHKSVMFYRDAKQKRLHVHRLVALAFIGPQPSPLHEVAHNDGNPSNNARGNLRWATRSSNHMDKVAHGTHNRGDQHPNHKITDAQVRSIRADSRHAKTIADEYGITWQHVYGIKANSTRKFA
jgi:hypothetical protein